MDQARRWLVRWRAGLAAAVGLLALGCTVPAEPSASDWSTAARQSLEDATSEVESVALVLELRSADRLPEVSARVAAVESEESLATAVDSLTTQQPPPGLDGQDRAVSDLLGRATDLVREARVAITAEDEASYADVRQRLLNLSDDLDAARTELG